MLASAGSAQTVDCDTASDQAQINICADNAFKAEDSKLNAAYGTLEKTVDPAARDALKDGQQKWIAYRDAWCAFEAGPAGDGSIYAMNLANCMADITASQTIRLEAAGTCEEGDVSCVIR